MALNCDNCPKDNRFKYVLIHKNGHISEEVTIKVVSKESDVNFTFKIKPDNFSITGTGESKDGNILAIIPDKEISQSDITFEIKEYVNGEEVHYGTPSMIFKRRQNFGGSIDGFVYLFNLEGFDLNNTSDIENYSDEDLSINIKVFYKGSKEIYNKKQPIYIEDNR